VNSDDCDGRKKFQKMTPALKGYAEHKETLPVFFLRSKLLTPKKLDVEPAAETLKIYRQLLS
jgi:hypothetical protein